MRSVKGVLSLGVCFGLVAVSLAQRPSMVGGWKVELSGEETNAMALLVFSKEMLRIRPDGTFKLYRIEIEGEWAWVGGDLVLKPTKFAGQSLEALSEYMEMVSLRIGKEAEGMGGLLVAMFGSPMTMKVEGSDAMLQAPDVKSWDELRWVRVPDPPLIDRLDGMDQVEDEEEDFALYAYHYDSIQDDVERLAPELDAVLHNETIDIGLRWWAAWMLAYSKEFDVVRSLTKGLVSEYKMVRAPCASALRKHGDPAAIPAMIDAYRAARISIYSLAKLIDETDYDGAAPFLLEVVTSGEDGDRPYALKALAGLKLDASYAKPEYVAAALKFLDDGDSESNVKVAAARMLLAFSAEKAHRDLALDALTEAAEHSNWMVRMDAIEGLVEAGSTRAIPVLIQALGDSWSPVRRDAAKHLAELGAKDAIGAIEAAWKEEDDAQAREAMFQALRKLREKANVSLLVSA